MLIPSPLTREKPFRRWNKSKSSKISLCVAHIQLYSMSWCLNNYVSKFESENWRYMIIKIQEKLCDEIVCVVALCLASHDTRTSYMREILLEEWVLREFKSLIREREYIARFTWANITTNDLYYLYHEAHSIEWSLSLVYMIAATTLMLKNILPCIESLKYMARAERGFSCAITHGVISMSMLNVMERGAIIFCATLTPLKRYCVNRLPTRLTRPNHQSARL